MLLLVNPIGLIGQVSGSTASKHKQIIVSCPQGLGMSGTGSWTLQQLAKRQGDVISRQKASLLLDLPVMSAACLTALEQIVSEGHRGGPRDESLTDQRAKDVPRDMLSEHGR